MEHCASGRCWGSGYAKKESQHEEATKSKRAPGAGTFLFDSEKPHQKTVHPGGGVEISFSCLALVSLLGVLLSIGSADLESWEVLPGGGDGNVVFWGGCQCYAGEKMAFFYKIDYLPVTLKCAQEFVLVTFHSLKCINK